MLPLSGLPHISALETVKLLLFRKPAKLEAASSRAHIAYMWDIQDVCWRA